MTPLLLGDLFELKYGKSLRKDMRNEGVVPVFGSNGRVDFHNESAVNHPTVIVGRKGSIGEVHLVKTPCWPIDTTYYVEPTGKHDFDLDWLYRLLQTLRLQELNRSAAIPGLNRDDVYRIPILLPPLDDQIRIAHLLGKVERLIAQRKQHLQQLDDLLKSVFLEMFGDPVRNEKGWEYVALDRYIDHLTSGGRGWAKYYSDSGKRFIRSLDVQMNHIGEDDIAYVNPPANAEAERTRVKEGDVLLTITGSKIGRVCFVPKNFEEAYISQHVAIIRTTGLNPVFLSHYLSAESSGQMQIKKQQYGQAKPGLNLTQIRDFQAPLVDIKIQNQFATVVEKVEGIKSRYQQNLTDLESLYGALSQQAFKGELDLSRVLLVEESLDTTPENVFVSGQAEASRTLSENECTDIADLIASPEYLDNKVQSKPFSKGFARQVLAAEILCRYNEYHMTQMKLQKLIHLVEHHAQLSEIQGQYQRQAAGPYDNQMMYGLATSLKKQHWFAAHGRTKNATYSAMDNAGQHQKYWTHWQHETAKIDHVLSLLGSAEPEQCEIVSTLYAAWNDLILDEEDITDDRIIYEASDPDRWHSAKKKIDPEKWPKALGWMRKKGLTPTGFGSHTVVKTTARD